MISNIKCSVLHTKWIEDVFLHIVPKLHSRDKLNKTAKHIVGKAVAISLPRLACKGILGQSSYNIKSRTSAVGLLLNSLNRRTADVIVKSGGHGEKMADKNRILRLLYPHLSVGAPSCNLQIFVLGKIDVNRIVYKYLTALNKLKRRNAGDDFSTGVKMMQCIITHGGTVFKVIVSAFMTEYLLMILVYHRIRAGYAKHRKIIIKKGL